MAKTTKRHILHPTPVDIRGLMKKYAKGADTWKRGKVLGHKIEVRSCGSAKGRGVFALSDMKKGEVVEVCPMLLYQSEFMVDECELSFYAFATKWSKYVALPLGFGILYNHSTNDPNVEYEQDYETLLQTYVALRPIKKGEELTVNYQHEIGETSLLVTHEVDPIKSARSRRPKK